MRSWSKFIVIWIKNTPFTNAVKFQIIDFEELFLFLIRFCEESFPFWNAWIVTQHENRSDNNMNTSLMQEYSLISAFIVTVLRHHYRSSAPRVLIFLRHHYRSSTPQLLIFLWHQNPISTPWVLTELFYDSSIVESHFTTLRHSQLIPGMADRPMS